MIIFQDYENSNNKEEFILKAIDNFKSSSLYQESLISRKYFEGNNDIENRRALFYDENYKMREDIFKANNRISNNFYKYIILQETSYLLSNGVGLDEKFKNKVCGLNEATEIATKSALLDARSFVYCYKENNNIKLKNFPGNSFIPFFDEMNGSLRAGIHFWQIEKDRPVYLELFEEDGMTIYKIIENEMIEVNPKTSYDYTKLTDATGTRIINNEELKRLPIAELKADEQLNNRLSNSLKTKIDLFDIVLSDFGNNLEDNRDVYWTLTNYNGTDMSQFLADFKHFKTVKVEEDGNATPHTIDVPYQAREVALELIKKEIMFESMSLDPSSIQGNVTNQVIKSAYANLDLKVDQLETNVKKFIKDILEIYSQYTKTKLDDEPSVSFVRNALMNETETIDNLVTQLSAGLISQETALKWNPYVDDEKEEMRRINEENLKVFDKREIVEEV